MKCPNCGAKMKEDQLYCENCGMEIQIVPDFEPEIENSIHKNLLGVVDDVLYNEQDSGDLRNKKLKRNILISGCGVVFILLIGISIALLKNFQNHSVHYQVTRAEACFQSGNSMQAITHYERAVELDPTKISIWFILAELYKNYDESKFKDCLMTILSSDYALEDEIETAYKKLIAYYKEKEDYASINTLLVNTKDDSIKLLFQSYMAMPPEFSYQEGSYDEVIPLKLTAGTQGTIYYTMDGTIPDKNSEVYITPIFLETGKYVVTAMFVNQYGIESEVVAKTYTIEVLRPSAPEVLTYSGEYDSPVMINVQVPSDCTVYYTMDGSIPTDQSNAYIAPIPMPLGKSVFKFVAYNKEGLAGDCTIREFDFHLNTEFTTQMAISNLLDIMIKNGKIQDYNGNNAESQVRYLYQFQYVLSIPDRGNFYVISESLEDSTGIQSKTGTNYAVNAITKEYYKLSLDALDNYVLEPIQ